MKHRNVTVAAVQMRCSADPAENLRNAEQYIRQAAEKGAQIILLPELFERPYFCQERRYDYYDYALPTLENPAVRRCMQLAAELQVVLPVSFYERDGNCLYNSVAMIDASLDFTRIVTTVAVIVAQHHNRSFFGKYRYAVQGSYCVNHASTRSYSVDFTRKEISPHTLWKPDCNLGKTVLLAVIGYGSDQKSLPKDVFVFERITFGRVGVLIVQRLAKSKSL